MAKCYTKSVESLARRMLSIGWVGQTIRASCYKKR